MYLQFVNIPLAFVETKDFMGLHPVRKFQERSVDFYIYIFKKYSIGGGKNCHLVCFTC